MQGSGLGQPDHRNTAPKSDDLAVPYQVTETRASGKLKLYAPQLALRGGQPQPLMYNTCFMPPPEGRNFGPYEIVAPIGEGGMGEVFKARDRRLDRIVALKTSRDRFSDRFAHEARAIAALNHPHIATLYDVGPDYLVMEFVEGETLRGPLPIPRVLQYARQILEALEAAHRRGIVHRDLKPANIMVAKNGVKLLDFGLAKVTPLGPLAET